MICQISCSNLVLQLVMSLSLQIDRFGFGFLKKETVKERKPLNYINRNWCFYCLPCKILDHQPKFTPLTVTSPIILWSTFSVPPLIYTFLHYSSGIPEISNPVKYPMLSCKDHRSKIYSTICSPFFTHRNWTTT